MSRGGRGAALERAREAQHSAQHDGHPSAEQLREGRARAREQRSAVESSVYSALERALLRLESGLGGLQREPLHARLLQMIPRRVSEDVDSLGLELNPHVGPTLIINPTYYLHTLKSHEQRASALRHLAQHLYLSHPIRAYRALMSSEEPEAELAPRFAFAAECECVMSLPERAPLEGELTVEELERLGLRPGMSAESIHELLTPLWREAQALHSSPKSSESAPEGSKSASKGSKSAPEGSQSASEGSQSAAQGSKSTSKGSKSVAQGSKSTAQGSKSAPEGSKSAPEGSKSAPEGSKSASKGSKSTSKGSKSAASPSQRERAELLLELASRTCPCDQRLWLHPHKRAGGLSPLQMRGLKLELERLMWTARESLSVDQLRAMSDEERALTERIERRHQLKPSTKQRQIAAQDELITSQRAAAKKTAKKTPPKRPLTPQQRAQELLEREQLRLSETEREVQSIITEMLRYDAFYGHLLLRTARQVTRTIKTAAVVMRDQTITLLINPDFFMLSLETREERGGVLKHELLHIALKHVLMINHPAFKDKQLYNIAADMEVNYLIEYPWELPEGAITPASFPELNLPYGLVAERYYQLLLEAKRDGQLSEPMLQQAIKQSGRWSSHQEWESGAQEPGGAQGGGTSSASPDPKVKGKLERRYGELIQPLPLSELTLQGYGLKVDQHIQEVHTTLERLGCSSSGASEFENLRKKKEHFYSQTRWEDELRLFVGGLSDERTARARRHSWRKPNRRYAQHTRRALSAARLTADALAVIARRSPHLLPKLTWGALTKEQQAQAKALSPALNAHKLTARSALPWALLPLATLYELLRDKPALAWPSWGEVSDQELGALSIKRTPLSPDQLPSDVYALIAREAPERLPELSWERLGLTHSAELKRLSPHLKLAKRLTWPQLSTSALSYLLQALPELFTLTWAQLPPHLLAKLPHYQKVEGSYVKVERLVRRPLPALVQHATSAPRLLCVIDTSGSMTSDLIQRVFDELDSMQSSAPCELHVLQVDTVVRAYYPYRGVVERFAAGRGGTNFTPAFEWMERAQSGVFTPVFKPRQDGLPGHVVDERVTQRFDGVIYLTDGYAHPPQWSNVDYPVMWVLTPQGSDHSVSSWAHTSKIVRLPGATF